MIITVNESKEAPPEGTPMHYMTTNANLHMCIWLKQWNKITMNEESLQFSPHGTFTWKIIESLRRVLYEMNPLLDQLNMKPWKHGSMQFMQRRNLRLELKRQFVVG